MQTYQMFFIKFLYIEHYDARVEDDFFAKNNSLKVSNG